MDVVFAEGMSTRREREGMMRRDVCVEGERGVRGERRGDEEDVCVEGDRERVVKRVYV